MKMVCPSCGAVHSAEAWANDAIARQCLLIVAELPSEISKRCLAYLALFRPGTGRGLKWDKALRIMAELRDLVACAHVQWEGRVARPNNAHAWAQAMERVIGQPPKHLPLKSHGYLRAVAYEIADEMDRAVEVKRNQAERCGTVRVQDGVRGEPETPLSREEIRRIREEAKIRGQKTDDGGKS